MLSWPVGDIVFKNVYIIWIFSVSGSLLHIQAASFLIFSGQMFYYLQRVELA